jgi:hypothetical protein
MTLSIYQQEEEEEEAEGGGGGGGGIKTMHEGRGRKTMKVGGQDIKKNINKL